MRKCLELAERGMGNVAPNPMVGSVIVYKEQIIGEGYHEQFGFAHAEVNAINSVENGNVSDLSCKRTAAFPRTPLSGAE